METLIQDIRYGIRMLRSTPGFTTVAILTLALGIGANTAIFTVVNAVLLQPLPYKDADRLMIVTEKTERAEPGSVSYLNFQDWRAQNRSFAELAVFRNPIHLNLVLPDGPQVIAARMVSANLLATLGVQPITGRDFRAEDDRVGAAPTAILSYGAWQTYFGGDPAALGKALAMNGLSYTIIGVLPSEFTLYGDCNVYLPIGRESWTLRQYRAGMNAVGRLKPGVTRAQAQADMDAIAERLAELYPQANAKRGVAITPIFEDVAGDVGSTLYLLFGAVGLVLLIACVNTANLLLARSAARRKEIAIRSAMGAGRGRIARQLLTESVLLALAGGIAGVVFAASGTHALIAAVPGSLPRIEAISLDWSVLAFALGVACITGIAFGLAPVWQALRPGVQDALKEGGQQSTSNRHGVQNALVAGEVALTLVLLVGAGLTLRSTLLLLGVNPGFDPHHVVSFKVFLSPNEYPQGERIYAFYRQLQDRLRATPGVEAASMAMGALPMEGGGHAGFYVSGRQPLDAAAMPQALGYVNSADYARVMGIHLLQGRYFSRADTVTSPRVTVIDSVAAETAFPGENPIGQHIVLALPPFDQPMEVVGVVNHVKHWGLDADDHAAVQNQVYMSCDQLPLPIYAGARQGLMMVLRSTLPASRLVPQVEEAVHRLNRNLPIYRLQTMDEVVADSLASRRFTALLLMLFAGAALLLAAIGIYGVMAYAVTLRTHEIGIRMALGAQPTQILQTILRQGGKLSLAGIVLGLAASAGATKLIAQQLYGVGTADPLTLSCVVLLLAGVAMAACYVPARRAMAVDPLIALRGGINSGADTPVRVARTRMSAPLLIPAHTAPASVIETYDLCKTYRAFPGKRIDALRGVSLRVEAGSIFGLIGQNGAGKTTLVKILLGLAQPTGGSARLLGGHPSDPRVRRAIGYLPEQMRLPDYMRATNFLRFMGDLKHLDSHTLDRRIPELLEQVGLAGVDRPVKEYSKGMQQRLGLAQALLNDPQVLFLDEPTDGLDPLGRKDVRNLIVALRDRGKTIFLNSHLLSEIELICDHIVVLNHGVVARTATPADFTRGTGEVLVRLAEVNAAVRAALAGTPCTWQGTTVRFTARDRAHLNQVLDRLRAIPVEIEAVEPVKLSLEQFFMEAVS